MFIDHTDLKNSGLVSFMNIKVLSKQILNSWENVELDLKRYDENENIGLLWYKTVKCKCGV